MTRPLLKRPSRAQLEELIDEATIDCYSEDEQHTGLLTMIEEHVVCPFRAKVISENVEVTGFQWPGHGLLAICRRNGKTHPVDIDSLEWIEPLPEGYESIAAYQAWRKRIQ
ncbi:hypothetical protein BH20ACI3_BH20ACI3_41450 [soil metagenome]